MPSTTLFADAKSLQAISIDNHARCKVDFGGKNSHGSVPLQASLLLIDDEHTRLVLSQLSILWARKVSET
jgi:hypothetical protein